MFGSNCDACTCPHSLFLTTLRCSFQYTVVLLYHLHLRPKTSIYVALQVICCRHVAVVGLFVLDQLLCFACCLLAQRSPHCLHHVLHIADYIVRLHRKICSPSDAHTVEGRCKRVEDYKPTFPIRHTFRQPWTLLVNDGISPLVRNHCSAFLS